MKQIVDLSLAYAKLLKERQGERQPTLLASALVPSDLAMFIEGGARTLEHAEAALDHLFGDTHDLLGANGETLVHKASEVRLHAPHPNGARIACAGGNFADHLAGMAAMGLLPGAGAMSIDEAATRIRESGIWGFWKVGRAAASPGADVPYPGRADRLDYEGEVAIVLGKQGKDVRAADAKDLVWGVTLLGDWSIRAPSEPQGPLKFGMAKNFDQSCSLGPCIVVGELDASDIDVETWVNGECRQRFNTRDMVFSYWEYIEYLSRDLTHANRYQAPMCAWRCVDDRADTDSELVAYCRAEGRWRLPRSDATDSSRVVNTSTSVQASNSPREVKRPARPASTSRARNCA